MLTRSIPEEIYFEIFLRLPVKSACVCKCVCKSWFSIISNPSFVKSHLNLAIQTNRSNVLVKGIDTTRSENRDFICSISHDSLASLLSTDEAFGDYAVDMDYPFEFSSPEHDLVELMGSCDGLVCLCFKDENFLCLWNPATREYKKLPKSPNANDDRIYSLIGLGYDSKSDDYKLVTCFYGGVVEVYSLELNSWTESENVSYKFYTYPMVGVLVNRHSHWLAQAQDRSQVVVSLDFGDQIFKEIQLPNELSKANGAYMVLGLLEGCLSVHLCVTKVHSEVWVMQDYGVKESWTKRYVIKDERISDCSPLLMWSLKSDEILFAFLASDNQAIYDAKHECVREANMPTFYQLGCYYESLVSLRSGTYVGKVEEEAEEEEVEEEAVGRA